MAPSKIVDRFGNPLELRGLTEEIATVSLGGVRNAWRSSVANSLTPQRLAQVMADVDQGEGLSYITLADEMEERDLHYRSVLWTRKAVVAGLDVQVEAYSDDKEDVRRADAVRDMIALNDTEDLLFDLLDGLGKGYSVVEIMWDKSGRTWMPDSFKHVDARHFQFDRDTLTEIRLRDEKDLTSGIPLAAYKFLRHVPKIKTGIPLRSGLARLASVAYMAKSYALTDWLAFIEVFGMPLRLGKFPGNATADQRAALLSAVTNIGHDASAIVPDGMMIEFVSNSSTGGDALFQGLAEWLDKQVSKGVLGQTASSEGTAGALGAQKAQDEVRQDIKRADAKQLAATLQRDLVIPFVDLNFGPMDKGKYPKVRIAIEEEEDLESLSKSLPPFIDRGLAVEASVIRDKFGLPEPEAGAVLLGGVKPAAPAPDPVPPAQAVSIRDALMARVVAGEKLTRDQRVLLIALAQAAPVKEDEIEMLATNEAAAWDRSVKPLLDQIVTMVETAKDETSLRVALDSFSGDAKDLVESVALATWEARAMGDADESKDA